jgi:hypothetical protein
MLRRTAIILVAALASFYLTEDLSLRFHIPRGREPLGHITVYRYDAIRQKNGKVDFESETPSRVTCVHALLPHMTYAPCWYVARHSDQRIDF